MCTVEHLERVGKESREWRYLVKEDVCDADATQVVSIQPEYEWDILSIRVQKLLLKNHTSIEDAVEKMEIRYVYHFCLGFWCLIILPFLIILHTRTN